MAEKICSDMKIGLFHIVGEDLDRSNNKRKYWICKWECGEIKSVRSDSLKTYKNPNCGCLHKKNISERTSKKLEGQRFGKLVVLYRDFSKKPRAHWVCECDCGNITTVKSYALTSGHTKSCGCYFKDVVIRDLTGFRSGRLVAKKIVDIKDKKGVFWECDCDCGGISVVVSGNISNKTTQSCGCYGSSKGESIIKDILTKNNINFKTEYVFKDYMCARYDFAILDNSEKVIRLIEFDGRQHYEKSHWDNRFYNLDSRISKDLEKNNYAKNKGIDLIRIPYWDIDKLNLQNLKSDKWKVEV